LHDLPAALVTRERNILDFSTTGIIGSIIGAVLVLFIHTRVVARRRTAV
jgi:hypothetical protein